MTTFGVLPYVEVYENNNVDVDVCMCGSQKN